MTKVVYFGNERLVSGLQTTDAPVLRGLIERGYDVVAVVSHFSESQSRNNRVLEVGEIAKQHNIPLLMPAKPSEILDELRSLQADVAVLASYGRIVSQEIIDVFPKGIINIHPSLLPQYRGPTPIESAILDGAKKTGVSIMKLSAGMDEGPVYTQQSFDLLGNETKFNLYHRVVELTNSLFFDIFPKIIEGTIDPQPQSQENVSYSKLIQKKDGNINWNSTAIDIERQIRAYQGWPQSRTTIGGIDVIITKAHVVSGSAEPGTFSLVDNTLVVGTAQDQIAIDTLKPSGKKEMPIEAFLAGYKSRLSVR